MGQPIRRGEVILEESCPRRCDHPCAPTTTARRAERPLRAFLLDQSYGPFDLTPEAAEQIADAQSLYEPGRIERTLRGLGVTDIALLRRGGEIDQAAEQLIIPSTGSIR
jgi:hypothetical protein